MAGIVRDLYQRLYGSGPGSLTVDDLMVEEDMLADTGRWPEEVDFDYDAENPLFDHQDFDLGTDLDEAMMERPHVAGGHEDVEALREALIERARSRHMATDEFQAAIARGPKQRGY